MKRRLKINYDSSSYTRINRDGRHEKCPRRPLPFHAVKAASTAGFDGGEITSDGGALLPMIDAAVAAWLAATALAWLIVTTMVR